MTTSPTGRPRPGLAAAARVLVGSCWAGTLLSLGAAGLGCWVMAADLSATGEDWDGLGLFLGGLLLLVGALLGVLCAALARGATRGLRSLREDRHPGALAPTSFLAALAGWLVTGYVVEATELDPTFLVVRIVALAVALSGTLTLVLTLGFRHSPG
ncbi:hypothetical protein [Nocardioides campestrisoli]|uniref:hypothetical protein n=1 Tax=Nocardioides campestrisoli TaxID=2736757 RepID=UPI00163D7577|nr:hypothetical protein [Nocardioides campestrisoli]